MVEMKIIFVILCIGVASSELTRYKPRGWRPNGRHFNPGHSHLHTYYRPAGRPNANAYPPASSFTTSTPVPITSTIRISTARTTSTTTTERNREPTTQPNLPAESFDTNPALAIANSFAFNRPVYVYNTFPFLSGHVF